MGSIRSAVLKKKATGDRNTVGIGATAVAVATATIATAAPSAAAILEVGSQFASRPGACAETNGRVSAIEISGGTAYIGGEFTEVTTPGGQTLARNRAAAIDTSTCQVLAWNPDVNGEVLALAAKDGSVFIGGNFTLVGGERRKNLAEVGATSAEPTDFRPVVRGYVGALDTSSTRLYAAGGINSVNGVQRFKAAAFSLSTGALDDGWRPRADRQVKALAVAPDGGRVYLGGSFSTLNGSTSDRYLAAVSPTSGDTDRSFRPEVRVHTTELVTAGGRIGAALAGGGGRVAVYDTGGNAQAVGWADGNAQAVEIVGDEVVTGGHFANFCAGGGNCQDPIRRTKAFSLEISTGELTDFAPQFNSTFGVWALAHDPSTGRLFAGGDFTESGNVPAHHLAMFTS